MNCVICKGEFKPLPNITRRAKTCGENGCRTEYRRMYNNTLSSSIERKKYMTLEEVQKILDYQKRNFDEGVYLATKLIANLGLRRGEVLLLQAGDFNFQSKPIEVSITTLKHKGHPKYTIDCDGDTAGEVLGYIKKHKLKPADFLFRINYGMLHRRFKKACKERGLPDYYGLHSLRHFRAIMALKASDGDIDYVRRLLRHTRVDMTLRYLHTLPEKRKKIIEKSVYL